MSTQTIPSLDGVAGRVIRPDDAEYDKARTPFYGGVDSRPAAIVRVADANDVSRVISLVRETGTEFIVRKHGLTIDDLLAAEIVTADGQLRRVDAKSEPDLFWAIRGGGGNFGVATRFQFRLHPVGTIVGGMMMLPATPDVIHSFIALAE